jgi:hypothetical protein
MTAFCANCGASRTEEYSFCSKCGTKQEKNIEVQEVNSTATKATSDTNSVIDMAVGTKPFNIKIAIYILGGLIGLGIILSGITHQGTQSTNSVESSQATDPVVNSEYYIFTKQEAIRFWDKKLGIDLNQSDKFVGGLFPSISGTYEIYSAPYIQLLIFPTAEALAEDQTNLEADVNSFSNRGWSSCSNVVIVSPLDRQDEFSKINDEFCK